MPFFLDYTLDNLRARSCQSGIAIVFCLELDSSGAYKFKVSPFIHSDDFVKGGFLQLFSAIQKMNTTAISKAKLFQSILPLNSRAHDGVHQDFNFNQADNINESPDCIALTGFFFILREGGLGIDDFRTYVLTSLEEFSPSFTRAYYAYVINTSEEDMMPPVLDDRTQRLIQELKTLCASGNNAAPAAVSEAGGGADSVARG